MAVYYVGFFLVIIKYHKLGYPSKIKMDSYGNAEYKASCLVLKYTSPRRTEKWCKSLTVLMVEK